MPRPDEGLIHAWLDGQLPPDEATRVEQLVATDAEWAAAAAEARGVIAASSRILLALDRVPSGVVPAKNAAPVARRLPWWAKMAAAVVLVAGTSTLVMRRTPQGEVTPAPPAVAAAADAAVPSAATPPAVRVTPPMAPVPLASTAKGQSVRITKGAVSPFADASSSVAANLATPATMPTPAAPVVGQVGGVSAQQAKSVAADDQAARPQSLDQSRQGGAQVSAQRTSAQMRREMDVVALAREAAPTAAAPSLAATRTHLLPGLCYELRESRSSAVAGSMMRGDRMQGDTLHLLPVRPAAPARAWLTARGGEIRGVLTLEPDGRGLVLVTAVPAPCPVP